MCVASKRSREHRKRERSRQHKSVNAVYYKFTRAKFYAVKLRMRKTAAVAPGAKTNLRAILIENLDFTRALSARCASCRSGLPPLLPSPHSRETSLNPRTSEPPISIMTSYAGAKSSARHVVNFNDALFHCRGSGKRAKNVETSRSVKTTRAEPTSGGGGMHSRISRCFADERYRNRRGER